MPDPSEVTLLLREARAGKREALEKLAPLVYGELRRLAQYFMRSERPGHSLQATALVHEAYLKLFGGEPMEWQNRAHFFAVAAQQMRRILVDHARRIAANKRGGGARKVPLEEARAFCGPAGEDILALDEALLRLHDLDPRASRLVELRFFSGLEEAEAAEVLGVSLATVKRDWKFAKTWLFSQLTRR